MADGGLQMADCVLEPGRVPPAAAHLQCSFPPARQPARRSISDTVGAFWILRDPGVAQAALQTIKTPVPYGSVQQPPRRALDLDLASRP